MKNESDLPLVEIKEYINVGMGGLHKNKIPIATNGILTCMGIGTHIGGINYFSHASPIDYSGTLGVYSLIYIWKKLLEENIDEINLIYLYTPYGMCKHSLPFLVILNDLELIDKTRYVKTIIFNNKTGNYTSEWNHKFKVGISKDGPWGYDYSVKKEEEKLD